MSRADQPKHQGVFFTFYQAEKEAKEHYQVIKSYKKMADATVKCRNS